ncbi:MAG: hypothetical protein H7X77_06690 [Anaerolineae bacterium]|nr:hypothetical protein [Anaerolineae bacterium]
MAFFVNALVSGVITRLFPQLYEPVANPGAFIKQGRQAGTRQVVVCAGDSITHGVASANYVELLKKQLAAPEYEFVNAGINGNLAYNVLQRLDVIIACHPDVVTLLIGTNDVNATFSQAWEDNYLKQQKLPEKPTLDWYRQNVERIVDRLKTETSARIAILTLPMLGEKLDSEMNQRVNAYNAVLQTIAAEKQVALLDLHEQLRMLLPENHTPPPYEGKMMPMLQAGLKQYILRKSWDTVATEHGLAVLTDHIHLNDRAAGVIARLIGDFIKQG